MGLVCNTKKAFKNMTKMLTTVPVLAHYDVQKPTIVAADASQYGLCVVLLQMQEGGECRPVCYATRSLTETEKRYAVIEKEALAATWACEQFSDYILGLNFILETDHKPLVSLLRQKDLSNMPVRIQRFKMRLMRLSYTVTYVPWVKPLMHFPELLNNTQVRPVTRIFEGGGGGGGSFFVDCGPWPNASMKNWDLFLPFLPN